MKMKLVDRLILDFSALVALIVGGVSLAAGILLRDCELGEEKLMQLIPTALIIAGAVSIAAFLLIFVVVRHNAARRRTYITQTNENGELRIAISAIETLVLQCVESHKELEVKMMNIYNHRGAIDIDMQVSMNSNVSIPHAVEQLESQIKRYLAASSGIEVRNITVSVDKTAVPGESPVKETVQEPESAEACAAEKEREKEREKEKIPMHQRIFGRDPEKPEAEQIVEAEMIMPSEENPAEAEKAPAEIEEAPAEAPGELDDEAAAAGAEAEQETAEEAENTEAEHEQTI